MKNLFIILFLCLSVFASAQQYVDENCYFTKKDGSKIKLSGCVKIIENSTAADLCVYYSKNYDQNLPQIDLTYHLPYNCNEWQMVNYSEDYTICFVKHSCYADIIINFTSSSDKDELKKIKKYLNQRYY